MKITQGILITILIISFATALQGAYAYENGDSIHTGESGLYQVVTPVMKTSRSSDVSDMGSTPAGTTGVTGDEATNMINKVNGMIMTIMVVSIVIILIIIAVIYFLLRKRRNGKHNFDEKF